MLGSSRASYAKVGFAVVAGAVALVGTLVYFGGMRGRADEFLAETYYDAPVSGLSVGSDVNYRGVKVGDSRQELYAAYGENFTSDDGYYVVYTQNGDPTDYSSMRIMFKMDGDKIEEICVYSPSYTNN